MEVITYETSYPKFKDSLLKYTCERYDVKLTVLGLGDEFKGVFQKIIAFSEYVSTLSDDDIVMCCDSRDVFIWSDGPTIVERYQQMTDSILFGDDWMCFPMFPLHKYYPKRDSYLCSGVYLGYVHSLKKMFERAIYCYENLSSVMLENFSLTDEDIQAEEYVYESRLGASIRQSDQFMCSLVYLTTDLIELDSSSQLIQTFNLCPDSLPLYLRTIDEIGEMRTDRYYDMVFDRDKMEIYNEYLGTYPLIFHAPGPPHPISMLNKFLKGDYGQVGTLF